MTALYIYIPLYPFISALFLPGEHRSDLGFHLLILTNNV